MGWLKKITRPISKVLDKIIPNEIKPALPYLSAFAPFMGATQGIMGSSMLRRGLMSGALNLGSQLAQEGSEGEFDPLSLAIASGIGALSAPGTESITGADRFLGPDGKMISVPYEIPGQAGAEQFFMEKASGMDSGLTKSGLEMLGKGSKYLTEASKTFQDTPFSKEGLKAAIVPASQGTADLAMITARQALDEYNAGLEEGGDPATYTDDGRRLAIRAAMEAAGHVEDDILDAIASLGLKDGGIIGLRNGGRIGFDNGGDVEEGIMMISETATPKFGTKEYYEQKVSEEIADLKAMVAQDKLYHFSPWSIGMIEDLMMRADRAGVDISELSEIYNQTKDIHSKWYSSIPEKEKNMWKNMWQEDFDRTTDMGIFPGQHEFGWGKHLKGKKDAGEAGEKTMPTPKEDRFKPFEPPYKEVKDGGRIGMVSGGGLKGAWSAAKALKNQVVKSLSRMTDDIEMQGSSDFATDTGSDFSLSVRAKTKKGKKVLDGLVEEGIVEFDNGMYYISDMNLDEATIGMGEGKLKASGMLEEGSDKFVRFDEGIGEGPMGSSYYGYDRVIENLKPKKADGGMMSVLPRGVEMDYRGGGMIPMGSKERADDVPARLSKNEFVMTADAVRAAGGGSVNRGAKRMYDLMHNLEARV